jgi:phospholipid/cholesterol/gamma-HCH transport system substrate-binding protein
MKAELSTAQAVTPGQGQTVRVSGVQVGEIQSVTLKNGVAVVTMNIDEKYKRMIHTDAYGLLRPRTGLKDMFIELAPGSRHAPLAKPNYTIPVSNTLPDVNFDEVLSSLDADTRAYLDLLVNGAGQGLKGKGGTQLAQVFERFEPTHRDLARVNKAVAARGRDLQQLVNSLRRLNQALAAKQHDLVRLVDSSNKVFTAFAAEDTHISRAVADLPGTLTTATSTLHKVTTLAQVLRPAAINLQPAAHALPAANEALKNLAIPATPIVKNEIRPFVIAARPLVRDLVPAARNLARGTPSLAKTFTVLNHLVNMLGFYPNGSSSQGQHGYLWWLAWLNHEARTLFSVQDANGDFRPLFLQASCATLAQIVNANGATSELVLNLTPILSNANICPTQATSNARAYNLYKQGKLSPSALNSSALQSAQPPTATAATRGTSTAGASTALTKNLPFLPKLPTK